jgi:hypothetical protein
MMDNVATLERRNQQLPKLKSNKNAITHGLYSNSTVIDGEKLEDFEILLQAFRDEYDPEGVSEDAAVFELASLEWKRSG